ncbi:MAG: hypothetical protein FWD36_04340 [Treponema sp.]|nr:hypothetical protein [Treponema sp.]
MTRFYPLFFVMILTIPIFFGVIALQANECGKLRNDIRQIERSQENCIKDNKAIVNEIRELLTVESLEAEARSMGLQKMMPEDIVLIIMGGKEFGH